MDIKALLPVITKVLTNPYVIGTTIAIILYMNFCSFVANYRKKPPKPKKKKSAPAPAPAPKPEAPKEGEQAEEAPQA